MDNLTTLFGGEPVETILPTTIDGLASAVATASSSGRAILPWGGGTGQDYGYAPEGIDFALLDLSGLNHILATEPGDLTITVEAGVTLAAVQEALLPHRLFLPLDPPNVEQATIGGILAANAFGPSRLGYGTARDWLIGLTVVDAQGHIVKSGGKVVKNVTGYDLPKLHIGALGTLGIIAEATFKLAPLPETARTILITRGKEAVSSETFFQELLDQTAPIQAYLRSDSTGNYIVVVYAGFTEVVDQETEQLRALAERHLTPNGASLAVFDEPLQLASDTPPALSVRFTGPVSEDRQRHEALQMYAKASEGIVETLVGCGISDITWTTVTNDALTTIQKAIEYVVSPGEFATGYVLTHAPLAIRQGEFLLWSPEPPSLPLMRRLKENMDPKGVLNPKRFIGRI